MVSVYYSGNWSKGGKSSVYKVTKYSTYLYIYYRDSRGNTAKYKYQRTALGNYQYGKIWELAKFGQGLNHYINRYVYKGKLQ